jgi:hypothetical protein
MMTAVDLLMHIAVAKDKIASGTRNAGQVAYHHRHLDKIAELALQQMKENPMNTSTDASIKSTSDDRIANNTMRHQYRVLADHEKLLMQAIKDAGVEMLAMIDSVKGCNADAARETSIAKTRLEESVMWAVKGLTK